MQVAKWGNSLAIRIPASVVEALDLSEGDDIEVVLASDHTFAIQRAPSASERLAKLRQFRGKLPNDFKFARDSANER